jgi:hypothetical protein
MNFLSHYYHEAPVSDPYFVAGVIMPDLLSNYSKRYGRKIRLNPAKLIDANSNAAASLSAGIRQHYFVDGFFHDSPYFEEMTGLIEVKIKALDFQCFDRRLFAFSHVFLELMMDRALLVQDIQICHDMYNLLADVHLQELETFFMDQQIQEDASAIAAHLQVFTDKRFIYHYADDTRLLMILDALNSSFGNPAFTAVDKTQLTHIIHDLETTLTNENFPKFPADS